MVHLIRSMVVVETNLAEGLLLLNKRFHPTRSGVPQPINPVFVHACHKSISAFSVIHIAVVRNDVHSCIDMALLLRRTVLAGSESRGGLYTFISGGKSDIFRAASHVAKQPDVLWL
jgi:hypothetical protein